MCSSVLRFGIYLETGDGSGSGGELRRKLDTGEVLTVDLLGRVDMRTRFSAWPLTTIRLLYPYLRASKVVCQ